MSVAKLELKDLHKPWIDEVKLKCPKCGGVMVRVPDVLDVWFDSGIAFYASLFYPRNKELYEKLSPVDFIVEGHDQIAGWFFSLLRSGVLGFGKSPYIKVVVHGYMLDEKGREMHKSLGNYVSVDEVVENYGADTLRFWVLQNTIWEDVRFSWKKLDLAFRDLNILWNIFVFASTYMSLDKYDPTKWNIEKVKEWLKFEDKWVLSRINRLIRDVDDLMGKSLIHEALRKIRNFIVEDLSHWYIRLIRRRVWVEAENPDKIAAYTTLYYVLKNLLLILAPLTPFITEELYQQFIKPAEPNLPESIHMMTWPSYNEEMISDDIEEAMEYAKKVVEAAAAARMKAGIKIRQPLLELAIVTDDSKMFKYISSISDVLASQVNVKEVRVEPLEAISKYVRYKVKPIYSKLGPVLRKDMKKAIDIFEKQGNEIAKNILSKGVYELRIDDKSYKITKDDVEIEEESIENYVLKNFEYGKVFLNVKIDEKVAAEGLARDIVRRIQFMRKELDLPVDAFINVIVKVPDEASARMLSEWRNYVMEEVRAKSLVIVPKEPTKYEGYVKEWEIGEEKYVIAIKPI